MSVAGARASVDSIPPQAFESILAMTGLDDPGPPIRILIADERSSIAQSTPLWITGFANGSRSAIVVFPERASSYPDDELREVVLHEVTHVLIWRAAAGNPIPRWFNEGLAMAAGRDWTMQDRRRLVAAMVSGSPVSLAQIERAFSLGEAPAGRAYALSERIIRETLLRPGKDAPAEILRRVAIGAEFPDAFREVTGKSLDSAMTEFWRRQTVWNRWVPILSSSLTLWTAITLLALAAIRRRRVRDAAIRKQWEQEESASSDDVPADLVN